MAVSCIPIAEERVRAEIWMGGTLIAKTPFIKSFNVSKARGQQTNTFSATFEIIAGVVFPIGQQLTIKAGLRGSLTSVFTGFIESTQVSPAFAKPSYFSILLSGKGVLSQLENKKFTRRLKTSGQGMFCLITGGSANRPNSVASLDRTHSSGNRTAVNNSPNPSSLGGEHSQLTVFGSAASKSAQGSAGGAASRLAGKQSGGPDELSSGGGLGVHTHEDIDSGGPAFGVFSSD